MTIQQIFKGFRALFARRSASRARVNNYTWRDGAYYVHKGSWGSPDVELRARLDANRSRFIGPSQRGV